MKFAPIVPLALMFACGGSSSAPESTTPVTVSADNITNSGTISIDSVTDSLSEGTAASATALTDQARSTDLATGDADITVSRTCTANKPAAGNAEVVWTRSGTGTITKTHGRWSVVSTITASGSETRDWVAPSGQTVGCASATSGVYVNWSNANLVNGLKLTATVDRSHSLSSTWTNSRTSATKTRSHSNATKGTRTVTWSTPSTVSASGTTTVTMNKSVVLDHATTATTTKLDGTSVTRSAKVSTDEAAPLTVSIARSGTTASSVSLQSKTISSGTIISTDTTDNSAGGIVTKLQLSDLKYDLSASNANKCVPVSGTIKGEVFENATSTTSLKTFTITFGDTSVDSQISIAYDKSDAEEYEYSYTGCDLAREM